MSKRPRIAIKATNLAASLAFYIDTLGFELIEALPEVDMAVIRDNDPDSFWGRILLAGPRVEEVKAHLDEPHVVLKPGDILDFPEKDINARHASLAGKGLGDQIQCPTGKTDRAGARIGCSNRSGLATFQRSYHDALRFGA